LTPAWSALQYRYNTAAHKNLEQAQSLSIQRLSIQQDLDRCIMVEFSEDRHSKAIRKGPPIFVVSGGAGATGDLLARTVLAQFPDVDVPLHVETKVVSEERVRDVIKKATGIPARRHRHLRPGRPAGRAPEP
jgi:hypothetical protein